MGFATHPRLLIVHELLSGGSVDKQLYIEHWKPRDEQVHKIALDVARGMEYLHTAFEQPIIHRDLKSPNLLLVDIPADDAPTIHCKLADFGLSRDKGVESDMGTALMTGCGSSLWMAPEIIIGSSYNEKIDIYSYAMCLLELLSCHLPWHAVPAPTVAFKVSQGARPDEQLTSCTTSGRVPELVGIVRRCWIQQPAQRPSFSELVIELGRLLGGDE